MLLTPLEQFQIISLFSLKLFCFDFSITNMLLINLISFFILFILVYLFSYNNKHFFYIPGNWQVMIETLYDIISQMLYDNINDSGEKYFPFVSTLAIFILSLNLIGLVPYSFTTTSHIIITLSLSTTVFFGVTFIAIQNHKLEMLSLFMPANTSFLMALILVPIEFISYMFKPISLGVRLFANLMAGHTLLKVIAGFAWSMLLLDDLFLSTMHLTPLLLLIILMGLELLVAVVQTYVFVTLTIVYLNDSINLH